MVFGLDIGSGAFRTATDGREGPTVEDEPAIVLRADTDEVESAGLSTPVRTVDCGGTTYVVGSDAERAAAALDEEPTDVLSHGIVERTDPAAAAAFDALVEAVAPDAAGNRLCYTTPGSLLDVDDPTDAHRETVDAALDGLGFDATPVSKGFAVVYDQLDEDNYTGLGVCIDRDVTSVALSYYGVPVVAFSLAKGGAWVTDRAAEETSHARSQVASVHADFTLDPQSNAGGIESALARAMDELAGELTGAIADQAAGTDLERGLSVPVAVGGECAVEGIEFLLGGRFDAADLPFSVRGVRLAPDPNESAARGALAAANADVDAYEAVTWSEDGAAAGGHDQQADDDATRTTGDGDVRTTADDAARASPGGHAGTATDRSDGDGLESPPTADDVADDAIQSLFDRLASREERVTDLAADLESLSDDLADLETRAAAAGRLEEVDERLDEVAIDLDERLESQAETLAGRLESLSEDLETRTDALSEDLDDRTDTISAELDELDAALESAARAEDVDALETDVHELRDEISAFDDRLAAEIDDVGSEIDEVGGQIDDVGGEIDEVRAAIDEIEANVETLEGELDDGLTDLAGSVTELESSLEEQIEGVRDRLSDLDEEIGAELASIRSTLDSLEELEDRVDAAATEREAITVRIETMAEEIEPLDDLRATAADTADRVDELGSEFGDVDSRVDELGADLGELDATVDGLTGDLEEVAGDVDDLDSRTPDTADLESVASELDETATRLEELSETAVAGDDLATVRENVASIERSLSDLSSRLDEVVADHAETSDRLDDVAASTDATADDVAALREELATTDEAVTDLRTELSATTDAVAAARDELATTADEVEVVRDELAETSGSVDELRVDVVANSADVADVRDALSAATDAIDELRGDRTTTPEAVDDLREDVESVADRIDEFETVSDRVDEFETVSNRVDELEAELEAASGDRPTLEDRIGAVESADGEEATDRSAAIATGVAAPVLAGSAGAGVVVGGTLSLSGDVLLGGGAAVLGVLLAVAAVVLAR